MTKNIFTKIVLYSTLFAIIAILGLTLWDHFHGGVPGHNLLKRKDLPKISNWWGLLTIPLVTYISLKRIEKRMNFRSDFTNQMFFKKHIVPFLIAFVYGFFIVVFSLTGNSKLSYLMFLILFLVALFVPIYKSEYFLGFVFGLTYTFGGALPVIIALVLSTVFYLLFNYIRPVFVFIGTKIKVFKKDK